MDAPHPCSLRLQAVQPLDVTDCYAVPTGTLNQSNHATCVCLHPSKPLLAAAAGNSLAVYDLVSCTRLSRHDMKSATVEMAFSPDGIMLVLVLEDWMIVGLSMATWRMHLLVPRKHSVDKPLESCLLAVSGGSRASLFYCRYGKESVRQAVLSSADMVDAKGRPARVKEGWGSKLKLEPAKPILGLAMSSREGALLVLHSDGALRGYNPMASTDALQPLYQIAVQEAISKSLPAPGTLVIAPNPTVPGTSFIIQASRLGNLCILQHSGENVSPTTLFKGRVPGIPVIIGAGILQDVRQLLVVGMTEGGRVRAAALNLGDRSTSADAPALQPVKVEPSDLSALLDPRASSQPLLLPTSPAAPPPSAQTWTPHTHSAAASRPTGDGMLGLGAPSGAKAADTTQAAAAPTGVVSNMVTSMWSSTPAWAQPPSHSSVLLGHLQPLAARAVIHPLLPVIALQLEPSQAVQLSPSLSRYPLAGASPEEYLLARKVLSVPLLTGVTWESLLSAGSARAMACPLHSTIQNWTPIPGTEAPVAALGASGDRTSAGSNAAAALPSTNGVPKHAHFTLPGYVYFVSNNALCRYSLASRATTTMVSLPDRVQGGGYRRVHSITKSRAGAWLVCFEVVGAPVGQERWQWTIIQSGQLDGTSVWLKPGKSGVFLGPNEDHFAVVDATGKLAAVFSVAECTHAEAAPLYLYSLEGLPGPGGALPVFAGPAWDPVVDPAASAVVGCVMWQSAAGGLACRPLPAVLDVEQEQGSGTGANTGIAAGMLGTNLPPQSRVMPLTTNYYYDNGSSTEEDEPQLEADEGPAEPKGTGAVMRDSNLGPLGAKYWLPLQPAELVMQVAWQPLTWDFKPPEPSKIAGTDQKDKDGKSENKKQEKADSSDSDNDTPPVSPGKDAAAAAAGSAQSRTPCMGAILTNQRVLLVTDKLNVHACLHLNTLVRCGLPSPAVNLLWAGPALMVLLADGRIVQVTWTGAVHAVCHIASGHTSYLVGATPDALLLLRGVEGASKAGGMHPAWEVVTRPVSMLQPLVLGWSTLGILPNTSLGDEVLSSCRKALQAIMAEYDPTTTTQSMIWTLLGTCALDLAYVLSSHHGGQDSRLYLAAAAAAGEWAAVEKALTAEHERAAHYPAPPPQGSPGHWKLLAAAAGATSQGQLARASTFLQMAGEWRLAMVVAAAAGDSQRLYKIAAAVSEIPGAYEDSQAAQRLASTLQSVYGSGSPAKDLMLELVKPTDEKGFESSASSWTLGSPRSVLTAAVEVTQTEGLRSEEGEMVARAPLEHPLVAALGLDPTMRKALHLSAAMPTTSMDGSAANMARDRDMHKTVSNNSLTSRPSASSLSQTMNAPGQTKPGTSALDDIFGFDLLGGGSTAAPTQGAIMASDADTDSDSELDAVETTQQWKGRVTIREKGTGPTFTSNPEDLRNAVQSLRLAPPPSGSGGLSSLGPIPAVGQGLAANQTTPSASGLQNTAVAGSAASGLQTYPSLGFGLNPSASASATAPAANNNANMFEPDIFDFPPPAPTSNNAPMPLMTSPSKQTVGAANPSPQPSPREQSSNPAPNYSGLSPALAAGMQPQGAAATFQGLSPALAAGMQQQPSVSAASNASFQGLSPALAAGMQNTSITQGISPALSAGMQPQASAASGLGSTRPSATQQQPSMPQRPSQGLAPTALSGLSPALAAGMIVSDTNVRNSAAVPQTANTTNGPPVPPLPAPNVTPGQADALFYQGVAMLEGGRWAEADLHFSGALHALKLQPSDEVQRTKTAYCAQYLTTVQLLSVATAGNGPKEARLYRYAASMPIEMRHRIALTKEAVARNKQLRNFKYCAETLTWMVTNMVGTVPDSQLQQLQLEIQECDHAGGRNANVPADEDLDMFTTLAASCTSRDEVQQLVAPVIAQS